MKNTNLSISLSVSKRRISFKQLGIPSFALTVALALMGSLPAKADFSRAQAAAILAAEGNAWAAGDSVGAASQFILTDSSFTCWVGRSTGRDGVQKIIQKFLQGYGGVIAVQTTAFIVEGNNISAEQTLTATNAQGAPTASALVLIEMSETANNQIQNMQINFDREDFVGTGVTGSPLKAWAPGTSPGQRVLTDAQVLGLEQQEAQGWESLDPNLVGRVYAANGTLISPGGVFTPNSAIQQSVVTLVQFSKDIQISIIKVVVEGNRFAIRWDWMERDAVTGAPHFSNDMLCGELDSTGKILFKREYFDVYRQFELTPVFPPYPR